MVDSHPEDDGMARAERQKHGSQWIKVLAELHDAAMAGDQNRLEKWVKQFPDLEKEYEGLAEAYSAVQRALRNHSECFGSEYDDVQRDLAELLPPDVDDDRAGAVTEATRDWPHPRVVAFYQAFASSVVGAIGEATGHELTQRRIRDDGAYLCTSKVLQELRSGAQQGRHVRDMLLEILADRWGVPDLPHRLTREQLGELLTKAGVIDHIRYWEALVAAVA